ncbi:unnamed protein product [Parnassius apollo]|uniref:(apollo) hypothetical protein n=1 Tax=Parnassius apollo TaxID=110799 RepID=A0A8S3WYG0_PARAO|nr:unnamed protein product [Parnassius apollo]
MPRSKDKVIRPKPSEQNVKSAIKMVIEKRLSIRKAAEEFHVSKSLIGRYVKLNKEKENVEVVYHPLNAVKRVFSDEEEEQLVEYCLKASKLHYGICKDDFLKLAFEYAVILKKTYPSAWDTNKKAGIWPFNDNIFGEDEFLSSYVTDRPYVDANTVTHTRLDMAEIQPNIALPGPSQYANIEQQYDNNQVAIESPAPSISTGTIYTDKNIVMSPEAIRPFPKAPPRKNNTTRNRKGKTRVLTYTPKKEELELLAAKKEKRSK